MPFKNRKNAVRLCVLGVVLFIFFLVLTKVSVETEKRSLFNAAIAFRISSFIFYLCFMICFLIIFVKLAVTNNVFIALIYIGLFLASFTCFGAHYLLFDRAVLNFSRPTSPERFIKNPVIVKQLSSLAEELISRRNIFWIGNGWREFAFGINFSDGNYMFDSRSIPKNYRFNTPIPVEDTNKVVHLDLPGMKSFRPANSKILDEGDYVFCTRASSVIRRIGFDNVKLYPDCNIVQYQIRDFIGWDAGSYYIYFYSPDGQLPDEFKKMQKLNDNWYFDSKPRF